MSVINFFGFDIPLEWFIPIVIWLMISTFATFLYVTKGRKKVEVKTYVAEYDQTGLVPERPIVLKPEQEELTRLNYKLSGKERTPSKYQPITMRNVKTNNWERVFLVPKDSDSAFNPRTSFDDSMKTKSPSRMMMEFAVWLGNIRGKLEPGFGLKKNAFVLLAWGGFMLMVGIVIADYVLPQLQRAYH